MWHQVPGPKPSLEVFTQSPQIFERWTFSFRSLPFLLSMIPIVTGDLRFTGNSSCEPLPFVNLVDVDDSWTGHKTLARLLPLMYSIESLVDRSLPWWITLRLASPILYVQWRTLCHCCEGTSCRHTMKFSSIKVIDLSSYKGSRGTTLIVTTNSTGNNECRRSSVLVSLLGPRPRGQGDVVLLY